MFKVHWPLALSDFLKILFTCLWRCLNRTVREKRVITLQICRRKAIGYTFVFVYTQFRHSKTARSE